jgi:hypothetical protein
VLILTTTSLTNKNGEDMISDIFRYSEKILLIYRDHGMLLISETKWRAQTTPQLEL